MSNNARLQRYQPQSDRSTSVAASYAAHAFAVFVSASFELSSSLTQPRQLGHSSVRHRKITVPVIHHPARAKLHLPPGVEDQPF